MADLELLFFNEEAVKEEYYRYWLNAPVPLKPRFIYIAKNKNKPLGPYYALKQSIARRQYSDIHYYYHHHHHHVQDYTARLKHDPVLMTLALSPITTLAEINAYIRSQLTAEELTAFIGDTLTEDEYQAAKHTLVSTM